jgi:WD40 repeat protein
MDHPALSRDGKRVAVWSQDSIKVNRPIRQQDNTLDGTLRVYDIDKPDEPVAKFDHKLSNRILFAPDGQSLYATEQSDYYSDRVKEVTHTTYRFDMKTKKKEKFDLPAGHQLADVSPDGKALLTNTFTTSAGGSFLATPHRLPLDTLKPEPLSKASIRAIQFSPDGRRFLGSKYTDPNNSTKQELAVVDVKDGTATAVKLEEDTEFVWHAAWSPDGKRLVVNRVVKLGEEKADGLLPPPVGGKAPDTVVVRKREVAIRNLDGSDPKPLLETKRETHIFGIDWR